MGSGDIPVVSSSALQIQTGQECPDSLTDAVGGEFSVKTADRQSRDPNDYGRNPIRHTIKARQISFGRDAQTTVWGRRTQPLLERTSLDLPVAIGLPRGVDSHARRCSPIHWRVAEIQAVVSGCLNRNGEAEVVIEGFDRAVSVGGAGDEATAGGDFFADEGDGVGRAGGHAGVGGV